MNANVVPFSAGLMIFEDSKRNLLVEALGVYRFLEKKVRNSEKRRQGKFHQI
jgi:hypothetical protein